MPGVGHDSPNHFPTRLIIHGAHLARVDARVDVISRGQGRAATSLAVLTQDRAEFRVFMKIQVRQGYAKGVGQGELTIVTGDGLGMGMGPRGYMKQRSSVGTPVKPQLLRAHSS